MTSKSSLTTWRNAILASAALLVAAPFGAIADDATETVVVTGTRIPRPEFDLPSPTMTVGSEQIEHSGTVDLGDYLKRIPALVGSLGNFQTNGYGTPASNDGSSLGGLNLLDLRNLGYVRTLVLIDGHRTVGESTGSSAVDINSIPLTLIDRVEVATGGASAIYGADGVSGVVNFILKHNLEGIHTRVQAGTSEDGGGSSFLTAISVGHNFDGDKGNVTATFEGTYQDHLFFTQRRFTRVGGIQFFVTNPANPDGSNPALPANIPTADAQFEFSAPTGAINSDITNSFDPNFLGNGQPYILGTDIGNASRIGSSGMPYANDLQGDFQPLNRRQIAQVDANYEFSRYLTVNAEFRYAHVDTKSASTAPFDDFTVILPDNAFLPANVASAIRAGNAGFGVLSEDYLSIRNKERVDRNTYRFVFEGKGDLPSPDFLDLFKWDLSYVYGQTDIDDVNVGNRITDRFFAALDSVIDPATGKPTCRSNLNPAAVPPDLSMVDALFGFTIFGPIFGDLTTVGPGDYPQTFTPGPNSGCVPFNPFGPNAASKAAIAFATADTHTFGVLMQHVLTGYVSADFPAFKNWGFAGPLSLVAGGEYRKEMSASNPDALTQSNDAWISGLSGVRGEFDVYEFFAEASLPVLQDRPFAKELSVDGAVRTSHYSTAGDSTSWKYGGLYSPIDGLKFRATDAVAVRAPNIGELFAPNQQLFAFVTDPCDATQINLGTQFRFANCVAIENAVVGPGNFDPGVTVLTTGVTTPTLIGGNTALKPETARTLTYGVVVQPPGMGLSVSLDWYDVKITNAIQALSGQTIANECVDLSTIDNPFCGQVTRTPTGGFPGSISQIRAQEINVASFQTSGIDLALDYAADTADWFGENDGTISFHVIGNWLNRLSFISLPDQAPVQGAGTLGGGFDGTPAPKWQTNVDIVWRNNGWTVDYNIDWYSHVLRSSLQTFKDQPNVFAKQFLFIPDRFVQGVQVGYDFSTGWNVYAGVDNLFYQKPAIGESAYPVDPIGRFFYVGVKSNLDFSDVGL
jgi:outer membrane receptor protein involved in Fe transport